jgi:uncharacterized protein (DUF427 family)
MRPIPRPTGVGQESVWAYPRPPRVEAVPQLLRVVMDGYGIARTQAGYRVLETSHAPVYYFPPDAIRQGTLVPAQEASLCEWKGEAMYFDVVGPKRRAVRAAWAYLEPSSAFAVIAGHIAFYAAPMDACYVGDEQVRPQPGRLLWGMDHVSAPGDRQGVGGESPPR